MVFWRGTGGVVDKILDPEGEMATKKAPTVAELMDGMRGEEDLNAVQSGSPEVIDAEKTQIELMMDSIAGVTEGEVVFWLHRASEKNKMLHGSFLMRYPKETPLIDIVEQARDKYGGGDFILLAKKDGVLFRKAPFTCEKPIGPVVEMVKQAPAPEDPFARLSNSIEKAMIIDRAASVMDRGPKEPAAPKGADPMIAVMTAMITGMQAQNLELLKLIMAPKPQEKGANETMLEAIRLGSALAGKELPGDGGGEGIMDMIKPLVPMIPQLLQMLTGKGAPARPVLRPGAPVPPRPLPGAAIPPAVPIATAGVPPEVPVVEDAQTVIQRRVMDEIRFSLTLPPSPKLFEHVLNYIDAYMPDLLQQAEVAPADLFAGYVVTLDPSFAGREQFFMDLHKFYKASIEEEPRHGPPRRAGGSSASRRLTY